MKPAVLFAILFAAGTALVFILVAVWDIVAVARGDPEASISTIMTRWASDYPIFAFVLGFVMGGVMAHLFWPRIPASRV